MRHAASEQGFGRWSERGVASCAGTALAEVASLNQRIADYDRRIEQIAKEDYPEVALLKQVKGVGTLIALTYVLTVEDPHRFPEEPRRGLLLGTTSRTQELRQESTAAAHQQGRRPLPANVCWCKERTIFWVRLERTVICGAGD